MKERIIAIIPARYASSRFPGKMLAPILGKSLIQRTYEQVIQSPLIDEVLIATDETRIQEHVESFGATCVMTCPSHRTGTDRIIEAAKDHESATIILNVQGDEPCISSKTLTSVCQTLIDNPDEYMATACVRITDPQEIQNPSVVKCVFDSNNHALFFSRSPIPSRTGPYYKHLGIYAFRPDFLFTYGTLAPTPLQQAEDLEQLKVLESGYKIKVAYAHECSPAVDTPQDIERVTQWIQNQNIYS